MIGTSRTNDVVTLELRRQDKRNALNADLCNALRGAVETAVEDGARAIVVTGQGSAFCAGADLSGDVYDTVFPDALVGMLRAIDSAPVPVIAAVNGPAIGAGCQLALACDLRVASERARFAIPAAKLGLALDNWTVKRLVAVAGGGAARTVLLGVRSIEAARAVDLGLAAELGELADAQAWAQEIARLAPLSLRSLKMVLNDDGALDPPNDDQQAAFRAAWTSDDLTEAKAARTDKRAPLFQGR